MITSLTLKHWRTHKETVLEFGKGTNVIVGVMGSGKSSIVNAISYALFGTFPALKTRQVSLDEIIMGKPNKEAHAETILMFEQEGEKYKVERIIKRDGTNEAKRQNGKLAAGPKQKDVNERVEKLLGLNYELFSRAVYSEQNEMDFFLKLSPSERKKKFDELLELEKYEEARKNSITVQNELVRENRQRKESIEQQKQTIQSHEEDKILAQNSGGRPRNTRELEKEIGEAAKTMLTQEKEYSILSQKEREAKIIEELIVKAETKFETLKEDIKKAGKINLAEITEGILKTKTEILGLGEKFKAKEKELRESEQENKKLGEEIKVFEYERKTLIEEEKGIFSLKGKCPTCKQELNEEHKHALEKEIKEKSIAIDAKLIELNQGKKTISEKINIIEKEREILQKETEEKNRELYKMESQKEAVELEEKKKQLEVLDNDLPKIRKQLLSLGFNKKKLDIAREGVYKTKSAMSIAETKVKAKQELKKSYQNNLEKIAQIKRSIEEQEKTMIKTEEAAKKLGILANCLIATQVELRESLIQTINDAMTMIWSAIYPYKDFGDAKLCIVEDGYDLQVCTRNNEWVRVEGILSGGERSAAALCIRIAFSLVLTKKLSMIILDEPTHNLDTNAVSQLGRMLREEMPKLVEQIFVITHDKELENAASSNLYLLNRDKDTDGATRVDAIQAK